MFSFFSYCNNKNIPKDILLSWSSSLQKEEQFEVQLKERYKIIEVDWLDVTSVEYKIFTDTYFKNAVEKEAMVKKMLDYYLNHKDKKIYKKTDYLCNEKEHVCICNVNAGLFRKIYDKNNYVPEDKYISYFIDGGF